MGSIVVGFPPTSAAAFKFDRRSRYPLTPVVGLWHLIYMGSRLIN